MNETHQEQAERLGKERERALAYIRDLEPELRSVRREVERLTKLVQSKECQIEALVEKIQRKGQK